MQESLASGRQQIRTGVDGVFPCRHRTACESTVILDDYVVRRNPTTCGGYGILKMKLTDRQAGPEVNFVLWVLQFAQGGVKGGAYGVREALVLPVSPSVRPRSIGLTDNAQPGAETILRDPFDQRGQ